MVIKTSLVCFYWKFESKVEVIGANRNISDVCVEDILGAVNIHEVDLIINKIFHLMVMFG